jgi:hypothetical protein
VVVERVGEAVDELGEGVGRGAHVAHGASTGPPAS